MPNLFFPKGIGSLKSLPQPEYGNCSYYASSPTLVILSLFNFISSNGFVVSVNVLTYIFGMTKGEYFFMCLFAILWNVKCSLLWRFMKCVQISCSFKLFVFLLSLERSLYSMGTGHFADKWVTNHFFQITACHFILLLVSFED